MVVYFRNDLIYNENPTTQAELGVAYVRFLMLIEKRSIIKKDIKGIGYYGFIDATEIVVIEPRFLNVSPFKWMDRHLLCKWVNSF